MNCIKINKNLKEYIFLFLIISMLYIIVNKFNIQNNTVFIEKCMISSIFFTMFIFKLKYDKGNFKCEDFISFIIIIGCIMRIGYMLYTPCNVRGQDVWEISVDSYGHAAYILKIIERHMLPETNKAQFYQQPFIYLSGSAVSIIINGILGKSDSYSYVDAVKIVSCFASCGILLICKELYKEVKLNMSAKKTAIVITAFLPNFYLMSARINCDALATLFMTLSVLYTVKYEKEQSWKNTISLAFIYGFALMTKISCGVIAIYTGIIMINKIYVYYKNHNLKNIILKLSVFGVISFPLGLWYSVRNYIIFKQKLTYVLMPDIKSKLYCGNHSLFSRFICISFKNLFSTPYAQPFGDYNYPAYIIKTIAFGEFDLKKQGVIPIILLFCVMLLVFLCIAAIIYAYFFCNNNKIVNMEFVLVLMLIYLSSIRFNISYPFGCSMDFRYIAVTAVLGSIIIGNMYFKVKEETNKYLNIKNKVYLNYCFKFFICLYTVFSVLMYVTL